MFLLQTEALIKGAEKVSPFSEYVYGFLVLLLLTALIFVWRESMSWKTSYLELNEKALIIFERVSQGYEDDRELKSNIKTLIEMVRSKLGK